MATFAELMEEYLKEWKECNICGYMCKLELFNTTNTDNLVCDDCVHDIDNGDL
tara:strand:+ start:3375 stop:3533 length:159 start_codon:yes stop_codon:yes gene_type:complete